MVEKVLQRERSVSVKRCRRGRSLIFKKYYECTMPHYYASFEDQQQYELNLLYKDLKDLPNIIQLQAHFHDLRGRLTLVLPDLGTNAYPSTKEGSVSYMKQMLFALKHLWNREIVHCNIKGGSQPNAIFDSCGKLTDPH